MTTEIRDDNYATRRPHYTNLDVYQWPSRTMVAEIKEDGKWCLVHIDGKQAHVWNRHGILIETFDIAYMGAPSTLYGEYMSGTTRSNRPGEHGKIKVFDCVQHHGVDVSNAPQIARRKYAETIVSLLGMQRVEMVRTFRDFEQAWSIVIDEDLEGLVFKDTHAAFGEDWQRMKQVHDVDYCVLGYKKNAYGTIVSIKAGARVGDCVRHVCTVPVYGDVRDDINGNPDRYIAKVFVARGNDITANGGLRGPRFGEWHADKRMEDL